MRHRTLAGTVLRPGLAAAAVLAAVLAAGCGSGSGGTRTLPAPGAPGGASTSAGSTAAKCGDVVYTLFRKGGSGAPICLDVGATLRVRNGSAPQPGTVRGDALEEVAPGVYRGVSAGRAEVGGTARACPDEPGKVSCLAVTQWSLTVDVR